MPIVEVEEAWARLCGSVTKFSSKTLSWQPYFCAGAKLTCQSARGWSHKVLILAALCRQIVHRTIINARWLPMRAEA